MNNINRGVLIGLRISLEQIAETIDAMAIEECNKEDGTYCNVPTSFHGENSSVLYDVKEALDEAVRLIREIVPQNADFEE